MKNEELHQHIPLKEYLTIEDTKPYLFCDDNLSDYEKNIYILALAYGNSPIYSLNHQHLETLSGFLEVDYDRLKKALSCEDEFRFQNATVQFGDEIIQCGAFFRNTFFDAIIKLCFAYEQLERLAYGTDPETITRNYHVFQAILHYFEMANAITATYECMQENMFSFEYTLFDSPEDFSPIDTIRFLQSLADKNFRTRFDIQLPNLLTISLKYEFKSRINALYLVTLCQIFKHSPCVSQEINDIADRLYRKLSFILKNGRIVSVHANFLHHITKKPISERSRTDNTTRLQLLYGYSNYDCYELRLDFSHSGQEFIHLNNESPGKIASGIFTKEEFDAIQKEYPLSKDFFIEYDNRFALKERSQCDLSDRTAKHLYKRIIGLKQHEAIFTENQSEESVNTFITYVAKMLPKECYKAVDTIGEYAKKCFHYDKLMESVMLLSIVCMGRPEYTDRMIAKIAEIAWKYGQITSEEKDIITSVDDIYAIAARAEQAVIYCR